MISKVWIICLSMVKICKDDENFVVEQVHQDFVLRGKVILSIRDNQGSDAVVWIRAATLPSFSLCQIAQQLWNLKHTQSLSQRGGRVASTRPMVGAKLNEGMPFWIYFRYSQPCHSHILAFGFKQRGPYKIPTPLG